MASWLALLLSIGVFSGGCVDGQILYPRFVRDLYLAVTVQDGLRQLTISLLDGQPYGEVDRSGDCAGGTVRVTGQISRAPTSDVLDLDFALQHCRMRLEATGLEVDVVVDGVIHVDSNLDRYLDLGTESLTSDALAIEGETTYNGEMVHLDSDCAFEFTLIVTERSESVLGSWCDRPISLSLSHED